MSKIQNVLYYVLREYPYENDLTKTRITKLFYLFDWEMTKKTGHQLTDIEWYFDHYGPYVSDVIDEADKDKNINIVMGVSAFGSKKHIIKSNIDKLKLKYDLENDEKDVIDYIIMETKNLTWNEFISYVYDTEPIIKTERYNKINFIEFI